MQDVDINYVAVLVAALVPMFLGALWYSTALFARPWMRAVDRTQEELKGGQLGYVISAIGALLMSYALARIDRWAEVDELGQKVVHATVFVETESQKQIVVGRGGSVVKQIGTRARPEIEHLVGRQIFLELQVKTRPKWRRDAAMLERLGI